MAEPTQAADRRARSTLTLDEYYDGVRAGDTAVLARALTLIESSNPKHQLLAEQLLTRLMPHTGGSLRLGITGSPGAGKSTLIETLGVRLVDAGRRVAVLAIDPSSDLTGGSILGDKTRMPRLAAAPGAYIRPSPASGTLGGAAQRTRESLLICEAAGFDVVLIETVGVGQSESLVAHMTDCLLAVMLPLGGDELQGIKKGLLEFVDLVVVNKADGDLLTASELTARHYRNALHTVSGKDRDREVKVLTCSALHDERIGAIWEEVTSLHETMRSEGTLDERRERQNLHWMWAIIDGKLKRLVESHPGVVAIRSGVERRVLSGEVSAESAARAILEACGLQQRPAGD